MIGSLARRVRWLSGAPSRLHNGYIPITCRLRDGCMTVT